MPDNVAKDTRAVSALANNERGDGESPRRARPRSRGGRTASPQHRDAIAAEDWDELQRRLTRAKDYRDHFPTR